MTTSVDHVAFIIDSDVRLKLGPTTFLSSVSGHCLIHTLIIEIATNPCGVRTFLDGNRLQVGRPVADYLQLVFGDLFGLYVRITTDFILGSTTYRKCLDDDAGNI